MRTGRPRIDVMKRFLEKIEKTDSCWIWTAHKDIGGYGIFAIRHGVDKKAHRISYELFVGPIPDGMCVCHKCDNRACVNLDHLFLGTQLDNIRDMLAKGRDNYVKGEKISWSKMKEKDVIDVYKLAQKGIPDTEIAKKFGVTRKCINRIKLGRIWKDLYNEYH